MSILFLYNSNNGFSHRSYPRRSDTAIVLDVSRSISREAYLDTLDFVREILYLKSISPGTTRIGLITFSSKANLQFSFEKYVNREGLLKRVERLSKWPLKGKTNVDRALKKAVYLFKHFKGLAQNKDLYIFSDGRWNSGPSPRHTITSLMKHGVKIYAFGIGKRPKMENLRKLASSPRKHHVFRLHGGRKSERRILNKLAGGKAYGLCSRKKAGKGVVDECGRRCKCVDGILMHCQRVRKEFTAMTFAQRKKYITSYKLLTTKEPLKSRYVKFITKHKKYFWKGIHGKAQFFPWHRWYLYAFENLLREVDCSLTAPFWDWSYYSDVAFKQGQHIWRQDEYGLGGNGDRNDSFCVKTGPFRKAIWKSPDTTNSYLVLDATYDILQLCLLANRSETYSPCLRRAFNGKPANISHVLNTLNLTCSQYLVFDERVRDGYHNDMHNFIGGNMCSDYAGNSPEFFLHHGFLDNIWYRWQQRWPQCANDLLEAHKVRLLTSPYSSGAFIHSHDQGESVNVVYEDFLTGRLDPKIFHLRIKIVDDEKPERVCKTYGTSSDEAEVGEVTAPFKYLRKQARELKKLQEMEALMKN
eukprot:gene4886-5526_t